MDLYKYLSEKQINAVKTIEEDLEIIACAGAGKTGVVTRRIINILVSNKNILPENIVAFTFTEKGADRYDAVVWFCEIPPEHADFIHLEGNANCARLYADDNAVLEGIHFTLSAKDEQTGAAASLLLEVTA